MSLCLRYLGRTRVGWLTLFHVVLARLTHAFRVIWKVSSGPDSPGRFWSHTCRLSRLPQFSSVCPLHPANLDVFSCKEQLPKMWTEAQGPLTSKLETCATWLLSHYIGQSKSPPLDGKICKNLGSFKIITPSLQWRRGIIFTQTTELLKRMDVREKIGQRLQKRLKGRLKLIVRGSGCLAKWTFSFNLRFSLCFCDNIINDSDAFSLGNMT